MEYCSVMLLDDEELIIQGLRNMISWSDLGCYICATANSGDQGKILIDQAKPDILIVDIRMPGISGLELAEYVLERYPNCKVIIISAYADFDFARRSIKAGVVDYLLKPIDKQELISAVQKAVRGIREREESSRKTEEEDHLEQLKTLAEDSLLFQLARYGSAGFRGDIISSAKELARRPGVVIIVENFNLTAKQSSVMAACQEYYGGGLLKSGYVPAFGSADEQVMMIVPIRRNCAPSVGRNRIIELMRTLQYNAPEELGLNVICVSDVYQNEAELQECYQQGLAMSEQAFFCSDSAVIEKIQQTKSVREGLRIDDLLTGLRNGQNSVVENYLHTLRGQMMNGKDCQMTLSKFRELQREITLCAAHEGLDTEHLWNRRYERENFQEKYEVLTSGAMQVCRLFSSIVNPVSRCALYIERHYAEHDLSLAKAAEEVGVNSSYLSRAFKEKYAVNFSEYLTEIRMERAKQLLKTSGRRINEIADLVGYSDAHYFGQVFRKKTGMLPLEYRQNAPKGQNFTTST